MTRSILQRIFVRTTCSSALTARTRRTAAAALVVLAGGATTAGAAIVATMPDVVELVSTNVRLDQTESDVQIRQRNAPLLRQQMKRQPAGGIGQTDHCFPWEEGNQRRTELQDRSLRCVPEAFPR